MISNLSICLAAILLVAPFANTSSASLPGIVRLDTAENRNLDSQTKIIEGIAAPEDAFPTIVFLEIESAAGTGFCGGSIISPTHVLTAAHCLQGSLRKIDVWAGGEDIRNRSTFTLHPANGYLNHPFYIDIQLVSDIDEQSRNDIAIIQVSKAFLQKPVALSEDPNGEAGGLEGVIAGWGLEDQENDSSVGPLLKFTEVVLLSDEVCEATWVNSPFTGLGEVRPGSGTVCTTDPTGNSDSCQGDSGGPLYVDEVLVGLTSYGIGCGDILPGVYTRVSSYICWLQELGIPNVRSQGGACPATAIAPSTTDAESATATIAPTLSPSPSPDAPATPSPSPVENEVSTPTATASVELPIESLLPPTAPAASQSPLSTESPFA